MLSVDVQNQAEQHSRNSVEQVLSGRFVGLQGRRTQLFWGLVAMWAALCGALASSHLRLDGPGLLTLAQTLLLVELAWGSLWDLAIGVDWFRPLAEHWPPARPASWSGLPYTRPHSPGGRLVRGVNRLAGWWGEAFWPAAGPALLGVLAAASLGVVLSLLLPERMRLLNAAFLALLGLGIARRRRGLDSSAGQALVQVGLGWLAGHLAFGAVSLASLGLALGFAATALGMIEVRGGQRRGLWLLNGGQAAVALWLAAFGQPLAAGAVGVLLFGQIVMQPALDFGQAPEDVALGAGPWMMAAMLIAAVAIP